ncbi:MAG: hypothetical protein MUC34_18760 [Anaerolineae bacterium]|nr:hypothetical protein [Anaerolineae bacterium]
MTKVDAYRAALRGLDDWEPYLREHSGLPGPRGNLELAHAVAQEGCLSPGRAELFHRWSALTADVAPENTPDGYLAFCGVLGLGALLARGEGDRSALLALLRQRASDPRWRVREAVATGLQLWGDADMDGLIAAMEGWAAGNYYEQRAAAAALCEPRLLADRRYAGEVIRILDLITKGVASAPASERKTVPFRTLRQALGYCWSVAVAADPQAGIPRFERWLAHPDLDVGWIMRENLSKKRIASLSIRIPSSDSS